MSEKPMLTFLAVLGAGPLITKGEDRAYAIFEIARGEALPTPEQVSEEICKGSLPFMVPNAEGFLSIGIGPDDWDLFAMMDEAYAQIKKGGGGTGEKEGPEEKSN